MHDDVPSNAVLVLAMPLLVQQRALLSVFRIARLRYPDTMNSMPHSHSKRNKVTHWPESDKITVLAILESLLHAGKTSDSERTVLHRKAAW